MTSTRPLNARDRNECNENAFAIISQLLVEQSVKSVKIREMMFDWLVNTNHEDAFITLHNLMEHRYARKLMLKHMPVVQTNALSSNPKLVVVSLAILFKLCRNGDQICIESNVLTHAIRLCFDGVVPALTVTSIFPYVHANTIARSIINMKPIDALCDDALYLIECLIISVPRDQFKYIAWICENAVMKKYLDAPPNEARQPISDMIKKLYRSFTMTQFANEVMRVATTQDAFESVLLIRRYVEVSVETLKTLCKAEEWKPFCEVLVNYAQTESDMARGVATFILLHIIVSCIPVHIPNEIIDVLRNEIQRNPNIFQFLTTDKEEQLVHIIQIGKLLKVADMHKYTNMLNLVREEKLQTQSMRDIGIASYEIPDAFKCPITLEVMRDPVVASDGHTYERESLIRILKETRVSPLTRETLQPNIVVPNINLTKRIKEFVPDVCRMVKRIKKNEE